MAGSRQVSLYQSVHYLNNPSIVSSDSNLKHTGVPANFLIFHVLEATSMSTLQTIIINRQAADNVNNRPFEARPSCDLLFIRLWAIT